MEKRSHYLTERAVVIAVAVSMLTLMLPSVAANHNSLGAAFSIAEANQVEPTTGEIVQEVEDDGWTYSNWNVWHENLEHVPPRPGAYDQSGHGYTECTSFHEFNSLKEYKHHLPGWGEEDVDDLGLGDDFWVEPDHGDASDITDPDTGLALNQEVVDNGPDDACYVGYLDTTAQYQFALGLLSPQTTWYQAQALYWLNPPEDDKECDEGDFVFDETGTDEEVHGEEKDCDNSDHDMYFFEAADLFGIDTNLVDTPIREAGEPFEPQEDERDWPASGTVTLPNTITRAYYLMGFPHPANEEPSPITATWEGWNIPFHGVPDSACGLVAQDTPDGEATARTPPKDECTTLTPRDLELYDRKNFEDTGLPEEYRGRLCDFRPFWSTISAAPAPESACGALGDEVTRFWDTASAGGFEADTADTWYHTYPGWKNVWTSIHSGIYEAFWTSYMLAFNTTAYHEFPYDHRMVAVNPEVPTIDDDAWCMRPQMKADGEVIGDYRDWDSWVTERIDEIEDSDEWDHTEHDDHDSDLEVYFNATFDTVDHFGGDADPRDLDGTTALADQPAPGIYGEYQVDAFDLTVRFKALDRIMVDGVYKGTGIPGYDGYGEDVYPHVDTLFDVASDIIDAADENASAALDDADETVEDQEPPQAVQEAVEEIFRQLDQATEDAEALLNATSAIVDEARDRTDPTASSDPSPTRGLGDDNIDPFTQTVSEGLACAGNGALQFAEDGFEYDGAVRFWHDVDREALGYAFTDPTMTDEDGEPARESNSTQGAWHPEWYTFDGPNMLGYVDNNENGGFSGCQDAREQPSPNDDACVWFAPVDVYGGFSQDSIEDLEADGYRVNESLHGAEAGDDDPGLPYGNGLVSSVELTGPHLVTTDPGEISLSEAQEELDRAQLINGDDAEATTCVVITSVNFHEDDKLPRHVKDSSKGSLDAGEEWYEYFCSDAADEEILWEDGFETESSPGHDFDATFGWIKLAPAAEGTEDFVDTNDSLCTTAVFSTQESVLAGNEDGPGVAGTEDTLQFGAEDTETYYTYCSSLEHEHLGDDYHNEDLFIHPLTGKTHDLPDFSDKTPAWAPFATT